MRLVTARSARCSWLALAMLFATACSAPPERAVVEVADAEVLVASGITPPASLEPWRVVDLPDEPVGLGGAPQRWYRTRVDLESPDDLFAVYLPSVRMNAAVFVNGQAVGQGGSFEEPIARNWNRPLLFTVPAASWRVGENVIHVRVAASPSSRLQLGAFQVGLSRVLRPQYELRYFLQITLRQLAVAVIGAACIAVAFVGLRRPESLHTLWFAACLAFAALGQTDAFVRDIPVPTRVWQWGNATAYLASVLCLVLGVHRTLDLPRRRVEVGLIAAGVGLALLAAVVPARVFVPVATGVLFSQTLVMGYVVVVVLRRGPRRHSRLIAVFASSLLVIGTHDIWALVSETGGVHVGWVAYVPLATALFAFALVISNLVDALRESELLNLELDRRVAEKHAELADSYDRMRGLEREQATGAERERIMREMHDGVGGLLVSTLAMVEAGERDGGRLGGALREALDEMRLVLDSLDPAEDDLLVVLATMRARIEPRLAAHGLEIDWRVSATEPIPGLTPTVVLHVLRIVQEAISNTIRHARANVITVRSGEGPHGAQRCAFLEISDDGCGMPDEPARGSHRGITNMRRRAEEIGGDLELETSERGTRLRVWLPLGPSDAQC